MTRWLCLSGRVSTQEPLEETRQDLEVLLEIADMLIRACRLESARSVLLQVISAVQLLPEHHRTEVLLRTAGLYLTANFLDDANGLIDGVIAHMRTRGPSSQTQQLQLAIKLERAGRQSEASALFAQVRTKPRSTILFELERKTRFEELAAALAEAGRLGEALAVAEEVRRHEEEAGTASEPPGAISSPAVASAAGEPAAAKNEAGESLIIYDELLRKVAIGCAQGKRLDDAVSVAAMINTEYIRNLALNESAITFARAGHLNEALAVIKVHADYRYDIALEEVLHVSIQAGYLDEVRVVARTFDRPHLRAMVNLWLAEVVARTGRMDDARAHLKAAKSAAFELDGYQRTELLPEVITAYVHAGQLDEAHGILSSIDEASTRARALREIADVYSPSGRARVRAQVGRRCLGAGTDA